MYELDPYRLEIFTMCEDELPASRPSKVIVLHTAIWSQSWTPAVTDINVSGQLVVLFNELID